MRRSSGHGADGKPRMSRPFVMPPVGDSQPIAQQLGGTAICDLSSFLSDSGIPHLAAVLCSESSPLEMYGHLANDRPAFLQALKQMGVDKLGERQQFANSLSKAYKAGRLTPSSTLPRATPSAVAKTEPGAEVAAPSVAKRERGGGAAMLKRRSWVVIGDVLDPAKPAKRVVQKLEAGDAKVVHRVNPRDQTGTLHKSLRTVEGPIDVIDLIINSREGLPLIQEAAELGIQHIFIQPGASSPEIEAFCASRDMEVHHGCVLVEAPW